MLILAGCGTNGAAPDDQKTSDNQTDTSEISKSGTFVGLADSHTVAVEIDGKETTFQVDPKIQEKVNQIEEGEAVDLKYIEGTNQVLELKEIEEK
jgi:hypothetical protein